MIFRMTLCEFTFFASNVVWYFHSGWTNDCTIYAPVNIAVLLGSALYYNMIPYYLRCTVRDPFAKFWRRSYDVIIVLIVISALIVVAMVNNGMLQGDCDCTCNRTVIALFTPTPTLQVCGTSKETPMTMDQ